jgi:Fic family protein
MFNENGEFDNMSSYEKNYELSESFTLDKILTLTKELKEEIDKNKPIEESLWKTIQEKLSISWTYNSNAIEGSTLTQGETTFFLKNGLTVEGKPFKDFMDAKNHNEAIEFLYDVVKENRQISEGLIKEFNSLLLSGVKSTPAVDEAGNKVDKPATPGEYKKNPNHVLQADGTIHKYIDPLQVQPEMDRLCAWINENENKLNPIVVSSIAHYNMVRIHPFDDGNGRGARILMNLILIKKGYPPTIIQNEHRRKYIEALSEGDKGNLNQFVEFVASSCIDTQKMILDDLKK